MLPEDMRDEILNPLQSRYAEMRAAEEQRRQAAQLP